MHNSSGTTEYSHSTLKDNYSKGTTSMYII